MTTSWPTLSFDQNADYSHCFCCGPNNPIGLKLHFDWDGQTARAEFTCPDAYQGWPQMVHGGIVFCLLDEGMTWACKFAAGWSVTAKAQVTWRNPAPLHVPFIITGTVTRQTRKLIETKAAVTTADGTVIAESTGVHYVVNVHEGEHAAK